MDGLIVTGISTDVGKTVVSAILAKALEADYWKPIEAGGCDSKTVRELSGAACHPSAYELKHPLSPHHAAQLENVTIDPQQFTLPNAKRLIIEGCGGVMVPYGEEHLGTLFAKWNFPWVVVSKNYLGSINHTLLTLAWLKTHGQDVLGIVFNGKQNLATEQFILAYSEVPCLGHIYPEKTLNKRIIACYAQQLRETLIRFGTLSPKDKLTPSPSPL